MTRVTRVVKIRPISILWITIQFSTFLYIYIVMNGSKDQELNLSIWTNIHKYIYFVDLFICVLQCICYVFL